jgi:Flp pilus assembly protein TadD
MRGRWLSLATMLLTLTPISLAQQWFSVQTEHLICYSDGNDRGAREAALRGEQLIAVFEQIFHRKDTRFTTPLRVMAMQATSPLNPPRTVLARTPVANFVTADLSQPDSWAQAAKSIAALTLEDNYPRAQPWFDTGIASYIAGVRFKGDQMELGELPPGMVLPTSREWIPLAKLFETNQLSQLPASEHKAFEAESWAVARWLIDNSRLAQAGTYLNAVQSRGAAPERALVEAFSMGFGDLDREVRESAGKLSTKSLPAPRIESGLFKSHKVAAADAHVLAADLSLFGPGGDQTLQELVGFMRENQENAAVHRSLAWAFLLRHDLENAVEHIRRALTLDDFDPSMHYLYALWVNQGDENTIRVGSAEVRMGAELNAALKRDPNYTAALELLGLAQLSSDTVKPALVNLRRASELRPRCDRCYLNLARAYQVAGNADSARTLMLYARAGDDPAVSAEAIELLNSIGKEKKRQQEWAAMGLHPETPGTKHSKYDNLKEAIEEDEKAEAKSKSLEAQPDTRKIEFLKGRIVSVRCGSEPGATLNVNSAGQTWQIHVADRNAVVLLGADHFDCGWHNAAVSINYKRSGNLQGELVSLEAN